MAIIFPEQKLWSILRLLILKKAELLSIFLLHGNIGASEQIENPEKLTDYVIMGELSLDGTVRPIKGALPIAIQARKEKFKGLILPKENAREAAMVNNLNVYGVGQLMK